jgi:hypothetical protein
VLHFSVERGIEIERFYVDLLFGFMIKNHDEIQRDYNEVSFEILRRIAKWRYTDFQFQTLA